MRILIAGHTGQVATELMRGSWPAGAIVTAAGRNHLDITRREQIADVFAAQCPDLVINAAAYTAVDRAESEPELAFALNEVGARNLAIEAARRDIPLIHLSSDYVFPGSGDRPWRESDATSPLSVYGKSKLAGERAVAETLPRHVILRTSWVFAAHGQNFVRSMLRLGAERDRLEIVSDQRGCPTSAGDLARVIIEVAMGLLAGDGRTGIYHYACAGEVTWYDFARSIFESSGDLFGHLPKLTPISTAQFGAPAPRPAFSVLNCDKIERDYGILRRDWASELTRVLDEIRRCRSAGLDAGTEARDKAQ